MSKGIAGTFVQIGADLAGLRAGVREARTLAGEAERSTKISLPVLVDKTSARLAIADAKAVAAEVAKTKAVVPVSFGLDPNAGKEVSRQVGRILGDLRREAAALAVPLTAGQKVEKLATFGGSEKQVAYARDLAGQIELGRQAKAAEAAAAEAAAKATKEQADRQAEVVRLAEAARDHQVATAVEQTKAGNVQRAVAKEQKTVRGDEVRDLVVANEIAKTKAGNQSRAAANEARAVEVRNRATAVNSRNSELADTATARAKEIDAQWADDERIARSGNEPRGRRGGGGGGGHGEGGEANPFTAKGVGKMFGAAIAVEAADRLLRVGVGIAAGARMMASGGANDAEAAASRATGSAKTVEAVGSVPVFGVLAEFTDKIAGTTERLREFASAVVESRNQAIQAGVASRAAQAQYVAATGSPQQGIKAQTDAAVATLGEQIDELDAKKQQYKNKMGLNGLGATDPTVRAMSMTKSRLEDQRDAVEATGKVEADRAADVFNARLESMDKSGRVSGLAARAAETRAVVGGTVGEIKGRRGSAASDDLQAQILSARGDMNAQAAGATTQVEKDAIVKAGAARADALSRQSKAAQSKSEADIARAGGQLVAGSQGEIAISKLRAGNQTNEAAIAATRESFRPRIEEAGRSFGSDSEQVKSLEAERDQKVQEQKVQQARDANLKIVAIAGEGNAAMLRGNHDFLAADKAAFDASIEGRLIALKGQPQAVVDATKKAIGQQSAAFAKQQKEQRADISASLETRQQVAGARGEGNNNLAGVIGTIAGMKTEIRNASPEFRAKTVDAQRAELTALQTSIVAPNKYMTEFDPTRDATGGPNGQAGQEQVTLLKLIADYMKSLDAKTPAAAAGV